MLDRIREKFNEFNIYDLSNLIVMLSFIIFIISLYFSSNVYLMLIIYLLLLYMARNYDKPIVRFLSSILPIIIFGYFLIHFIDFVMIEKETYNIFQIIIKILLGLNYLCILYYYFKNKNIKLKNKVKKNNQKYTFKELRKKNENKFREFVNNEVETYLEEEKIDMDSDYFKVIESNIDDKVKDTLEEYVWCNYLRFYKNKNYNEKNFNVFNEKFNVFNLLFLLVHVIILVLVLIVR